MEKKVMSPIVKGIIITLAVIAFAVITTVIGIEKSKEFGWVQYILIIVGVIWACMSYSSQKEGNVTFGNVFAHGFKVTAVVTCMFILYLILALKVIFPGIKEQSIAIMRTEMAKQPKQNKPQDSEQLEQIITGVSNNFVLITAGGTMIVFLIVGAAASLAGAVVAKKNPNVNPLG